MNLIKRAFPVLARSAFSFRKLRPLTRIQYSFSKQSQLDKLKQESKAFYENQVKRVHQFSKLEDWKTLVEESTEPVVIDLYADWCQPCKKLTPILEKAANTDGNWRLVKINVDNFPQVAGQFKIKGVPTVILISNKQFVDAFSGFPDENTLNRFMGNIKKGMDSGFLQNQKKQYEHVAKLQEARQSLIKSEYPKVQTILRDILKEQVKADYQPIIYLMLAHSEIEQGKISNFEQTIGTFKSKFSAELQSKDPNLQFMRDYVNDLNSIYETKKAAPLQNQTIKSLKRALDSDPHSLQNKYRLAQELSKNQLQEQALQLLLEIVKSDKSWQNKKANNLMLQIFKKLGPSSELTVKYRKLYQRLLY